VRIDNLTRYLKDIPTIAKQVTGDSVTLSFQKGWKKLIRRNVLLLSGGLMLGCLTACTQAPPPPPPDTRAADEKAIRDLMAANMKDWTSKDVDKIAAYYADDASVLVTNMKTVTGMADIKTAVKQFTDMGFTFDAPVYRVEVSKAGDIAYAQGTYTSRSTDPKTKRAMVEEGKWVTVFKKQANGSWKAVSDIFNADAPAKPAKAEKPSKKNKKR
jgi:uncharacterized protein (TIGR02246 family)